MAGTSAVVREEPRVSPLAPAGRGGERRRRPRGRRAPPAAGSRGDESGGGGAENADGAPAAPPGARDRKRSQIGWEEARPQGGQKAQSPELAQKKPKSNPP